MEQIKNEFYNLGKFKELSRGDSKFFRILLEKFITSTSEALGEIIVNQEEKDLAKLKALVHKIKPSVEMLSVTKMSELINSIQDENYDSDTAFKFSEELIVICTKLLNELKLELKMKNVIRI